MKKRLTISIDEQVYEGLHRVVGRRHISHFIESLVRPHVLRQDLREDLEAGYRAMAADEEYEAEALEWIEALVGDATDEAG